MKDPVLDFLRTALIPELRPNIAARSAGNGHLRLIMIATIGHSQMSLPVSSSTILISPS